jgi:hypothetical protein
LKYRGSFTSESNHPRHLSSRLAPSIARVPNTLSPRARSSRVERRRDKQNQ